MKVIDTSKESLDIFAAGQFDLRKWEHYIDKAVPGAKELCLDGMRKCINAGFSWENDYLPILNAMICDEEKRELPALRSLLAVRISRSVRTLR